MDDNNCDANAWQFQGLQGWDFNGTVGCDSMLDVFLSSQPIHHGMLKGAHRCCLLACVSHWNYHATGVRDSNNGGDILYFDQIIAIP